MKKITGVLIILLMSLCSYGSTLQVNPELQVMAKSGLKLRLLPQLDAPVIDVVTYGQSLQVVEDESLLSQKMVINWVEGKWVKVIFQNKEGYVFDGFLSNLNVPLHDSEFSNDLNNLSYALYSWTFRNFVHLSTDTLINKTDSGMLVHHFSGNTLEVLNAPSLYKVEWIMKDIRIMDAFHLLESMMDTGTARSTFKTMATFYTDSGNNVNKIIIGGDQIVIKKQFDGSISVVCKTILEGC